MMEKHALFSLALLIAACGTSQPHQVDVGRHGLQPPPDTCGAGRYADLIGQDVSRAPSPAAQIRIASDKAPITEDHRPERLNIFYDESSGRIVGLRCF